MQIRSEQAFDFDELKISFSYSKKQLNNLVKGRNLMDGMFRMQGVKDVPDMTKIETT